MRILLVEPDEYYHHQFAKHTRDLGQLQVASSYQQARQMLAQQSPDILVMELLLPDESGYRLLEIIREQDAALPVIIFSSQSELDDIEAALNFGVTSFFVKGKDDINEIRKLLLTLAA